MPNAASRGPGRPPAAKAAETRERIVRAARELFSELGYDGATFQAIAVRADLTRPAINHYFSSKRALWREVLEQTDALVVTRGVDVGKRKTTMLGRLSAFIETAAQADAEDRSVAGFLIASVLEAKRHPDLNQPGHDSLQNSRAYVAWVVTDAIAQGELSTDTDVASVIEMLVAALWGMALYAGFVGSHAELLEIIEQFQLLLANKLWKLGE